MPDQKHLGAVMARADLIALWWRDLPPGGSIRQAPLFCAAQRLRFRAARKTGVGYRFATLAGLNERARHPAMTLSRIGAMPIAQFL